MISEEGDAVTILDFAVSCHFIVKGGTVFIFQPS